MCNSFSLSALCSCIIIWPFFVSSRKLSLLIRDVTVYFYLNQMIILFVKQDKSHLLYCVILMAEQLVGSP